MGGSSPIFAFRLDFVQGAPGARPGMRAAPAEHPDPKSWRTEIYWPLAE